MTISQYHLKFFLRHPLQWGEKIHGRPLETEGFEYRGVGFAHLNFARGSYQNGSPFLYGVDQ